MKNKFVYFLAGAFLFGLVIFVFQISQASPAIPNPGHGTSQIEGDADLNMNSNKIINLTDPTSDQDAATKAYVDIPLTLSCHTVESCGGTGYAWISVACDYGTRTGGGCLIQQHLSKLYGGYPWGENSWKCEMAAYEGDGPCAYVVCCEAI